MVAEVRKVQAREGILVAVVVDIREGEETRLDIAQAGCIAVVREGSVLIVEEDEVLQAATAVAPRRL